MKRSVLGATRAAVVRCVPSVAVLALFLVIIDGGPARAAKFAGSFMADGGGARAMGMGSAFVAVADDASASFWNPAGLVDVQRRQLLLMHSERFGDLIDRDFGSYVHPLDTMGSPIRTGERETVNSAFAISVIHLALDDIAFTEDLVELLDQDRNGLDAGEAAQILDPRYFDQIRYETDRELAMMVSYARRMDRWQVGGNVKLIRQTVGDYSSFGIGVDLGVLRRDWWRSLDVGVKLQDATSTYLSWSTGRNEAIAPVLVPGAAYDWSVPDWNLDVTAAGALEMHFDGRGNTVDQFGYQAWGGIFEDWSSNLLLGLEASFSRRAHLRFGSHGGFDAEDLTFGAGIELGSFRVDYARAGDVLDIDQSTHRVSLAVDF